MKATLILKDKIIYENGYIQEMVIWKIPQPVEGSQHHYKYRLFFGLPDKRVISYDNERLKGDHRHYEGQEESYVFTSIQNLIQDFLSDVRQQRSKYYADND